MFRVRISLCIAEDDLRSWVMEELLLMTWVADQPMFDTMADPSDVDPSAALLIVDADRALHAPAVPTIAIGSDPGIAGVVVLPTKLTSRELKLAMRLALPRGPRTAEARS